MTSLAEELVLLAVEDDGKISYTAGSTEFILALFGACLIDLNNLGRVDADLKELTLLSSEPTGLAHLDWVLERVRPGGGVPVSRWLMNAQMDSQSLVRLTLAELVKRGVLKTAQTQFLWVFNSRRYPVVDGQEQKEAKLRILAGLLVHDVPTPHDTALIGLARVGGLLEGFMSASEVARLTERLDLVGGVDLIVREVESAVRENYQVRAQALMFMH
ncbi:MAG TPA: GPP34 family phosphoprotein [Ramlibacter sp.]|nr:GPP34 family phosphoprotein [Ramlibacter sp.]